MQDDIIKLLDIKDSTIKILSLVERKNEKIITLEKELCFHYCNACSARMYSKGIYVRTINHPILQNGFRLTFKVRQRRWKCSNPDCSEIETDSFSFIDKHKRNTNLTDYLIVQAFKNSAESAASIAKRFSVSDTYAINTFARYVDMPRRQLTEIISVDEVHLGISKQCNYALVIQDFITGEPLDMVVNRREEYTFPYFASIPLNERKRVKYIITDMYRPYIAYVEKYMPNAIPAVDAFHVIQMINRHLLNYIRQIQRRLDWRDRNLHEKREQEFGRRLPFTHSKDYLLLKKYHWLLLKNRDSIKYYSEPRLNKQFNRMMNTYDYEEWLFKIDPNLREMRYLKEQYISFNKKYVGDPQGARRALLDLISVYKNSPFSLFHEVAETLENFFDPIITSFILIKKTGKNGTYDSRLSNGAIESLNRIPKDMKRIARGYRNFEHIRNRFLFSQRKNAAILSVPKDLDFVQAKRVYPRRR